jgi:capsular exopolysaccharide synthesis family protein
MEAGPAPEAPRAIYSAAIATPSAPVAPAPLVPTPVVLAPVAPTPVASTSALPATPSDDRHFSPDKVRRYRWSPSLDTLPALEDRGAPVEQFRSLRSRMFEFRDLNKPQEGKSFVAANLAISFARHKAARVLLIDGDMRRSTLHKLLGTSPEVGLAEYLSGTAGLLDVMQQMEPGQSDSPILHGLASLTFIPGGSDSDKAADLSGNHRFAQLMATVSPFYDWIVVDSAPVNVVADGVNLARSCDGVLLVARGGVTKYETAQRALVELKASNILGFVLNAVENTPSTGGYYGYESYDSAQK